MAGRTVYDITEPVTHSVIAEGMIAHNCNLASLNLVKFLNDDGNFDAKRFAEASRIWTTTLEISVTMGQMPSKADRREESRLSHARPRICESRNAA